MPVSINFLPAGLIGSGARDYGFNDQQHHLNQDKLNMGMADLASQADGGQPFFPCGKHLSAHCLRQPGY